ncbi:MAG TPA: GNAT family N-acetyltransferase [Pyrinomonadaceae bacterium]|nr:GNAT family N-acetyltransferase [Pyrinomonadaceae bacterium]
MIKRKDQRSTFHLRDDSRMSGGPLTFHQATAARWADIEELFGERGACGGCWCMFWRLPRKEFDQGKGSGNKRALKKIVTGQPRSAAPTNKGHAPGIIAYHKKEPIGWCAVAPREEYLALERSRILKPVDDKPVWSVSCLFIKKPYRRQGVSALLLRAAVEFAANQGAVVVEGYPVEPSMDKMPDPFLWHGVPSAFEAAGFREVLRRSKSRPIMRFEIESSKARSSPKAKKSRPPQTFRPPL